MSAWAKPGVKCVCVDGSLNPGSVLRHPIELVLPKKGRTYTIAWVGQWTWADGQAGVGVHLMEFSRAPDRNGVVHPLRLARFRPLITRSQEQDVAKFRHLLTPSPVDSGLVPAGVELDA